MAPGAMRKGEENGEGRGYPNRLLATAWRSVRGDVVVAVQASGSADGERLLIAVRVQNRNKEKALQFGSWSKPAQATLKDEKGKTYPLVTIPDALEQSMRDRPGPDPSYLYGPGPVTPDRKRFTLIEFDGSALAAEYLDLDLDGAPVGFADPILFRIPVEALVRPRK